MVMSHCAKCLLPVYFAEAIQAIGKHFHRHCFTCCNPDCARSLDSYNCSDHDGKAYCTYCHKSLFGPKGVGFGIGAGILSSGPVINEFKVCYGQERSNPVTSSISYGVAKCDIKRHPPNMHDATISAIPATIKPVEKSSIAQQFYAPSKELERVSPKHYESPLLADVPKVRSFVVNQAKTTKCARCDKTVYQAEKMLAAGLVWHKGSCYTCAVCCKRLESRTLCEREKELYCTNCYARAFGPVGYGHGIGTEIVQTQQ